MECLGNQIVIAHIIWLELFLYLLKWPLKETLFVPFIQCVKNDSCACKRSYMLRSSSHPQKTLLLKRFIRSPAFNSVTLWHHPTSPRRICIIYTFIAILAHRNWFRSAVCELTNQSRLVETLGCWSLKRRLNTELQHWTEWDVFFFFWALKQVKLF